MKKLLILLAWGAIVVPVVVFSGYSTEASIPHLINYQGMLTDDVGSPLTGPYDLTFEIYDDTTGGNLEWSETQSGVQVQNGLFNVVLGQVTALDLAFDESYWLEVQVGTSDTMPRLRLTSVGYAYRAKLADSATVAVSAPTGGGWTDDGTVVRLESATDSVGIGTDAPAEKLHIMGGGLQINTDQVGGYYGRMDGNEISGGTAGGAPGSHHLHVKPGDNSSYLLLAEDGGNVGIGTITPDKKLHIGGGGQTPSQAYDGVYVNPAEPQVWVSVEDTTGVEGGIMSHQNGTVYLGSWSNHPVRLRTNNSDQVLIDTSGNVGVGTDAPAVKFHIMGGGLQINTDQVGGYYGRIDGNEISGGTAGGAPGSHHLHMKPGDNSSYLLLAEDGGNVGIGTASPQGALDVNSTVGALIVPRMTTVQRDALTPLNGMIIYNTTTNLFNFYENGAWVTK